MSSRAFALIFIPFTGALLVLAGFSLQWRMVHDPPIFMYLAYLIDHFHYVPYRDFFDINMPGTYAVYMMVGKCFGYSDLAFRCADLAYLTAVLAVTWLALRKLGWKVAWCSVIIFGLLYLGMGPTMSLQRDYLQVLAIAAALAVYCSCLRLGRMPRFAVIGGLFGLAATVKPHSLIGLFPVVLIDALYPVCSDDDDGLRLHTRLLLNTASSLAGFAIPTCAMVCYLWRAGALPCFVDIARSYWPLYGGLTNTCHTVFGFSHIKYLARQYVEFGGSYNTRWVLPAIVGGLISLFGSTLTGAQKRQVVIMAGLCFLYSIYPVFGGKFFAYHYAVFLYLLVLLGALSLVDRSGDSKRIDRLIPVIILLVTICLGVRPPEGFFGQIRGHPIQPPKEGEVDQVAGYLRAHMEPGDKVQPLDWTHLALHAMLIARAEVATRFIYDEQFYHHVSMPYIQNLRRQFIRELSASKPRFIVQVNSESKPWCSGPDTTRQFEGLERVLHAHYVGRVKGDSYVIYEKRRW